MHSFKQSMALKSTVQCGDIWLHVHTVGAISVEIIVLIKNSETIIYF
jgi:hypothetical protein